MAKLNRESLVALLNEAQVKTAKRGLDKEGKPAKWGKVTFDGTILPCVGDAFDGTTLVCKNLVLMIAKTKDGKDFVFLDTPGEEVSDIQVW